MIPLPSGAKVWLATGGAKAGLTPSEGHTEMRKGIVDFLGIARLRGEGQPPSPPEIWAVFGEASGTELQAVPETMP